MAQRQFGNRGSKVTIVWWADEDGTFQFEAYSASGERPGSHKSAKDAVAELTADEGVFFMHPPETRTLTIK